MNLVMWLNIRITSLLLLFVIQIDTSSTLFAQNHAFEVGTYAGAMFGKAAGFPSQGPHTAIALNWTNRHHSYWYKAWHEPETGLTFTFHDFGNPEVLGYGYGLQYHMLMKGRYRKNFRYFGRARIGGIYHTRKYDENVNPGNVMTGSHLAYISSLGGGMEVVVSQRSRLIGEFSLWHSSNAGYSLPNTGFNTAMLSMAYRYYLKEEAYLGVPKPVDTCQLRKWQVVSQFAYGLGQNHSTSLKNPEELYNKFRLSFGFQRRYKPAFRAMLSVDAIWDEAYEAVKEEVNQDEDAQLSPYAVSLMLGHEFIYNHFGLIFQGGLNLFNPTHQYIFDAQDDLNLNEQLQRNIPGRLSVRYYFWNLWRYVRSPFAQIGIKSNFTRADYLEFGVGFTL